MDDLAWVMALMGERSEGMEWDEIKESMACRLQTSGETGSNKKKLFLGREYSLDFKAKHMTEFERDESN